MSAECLRTDPWLGMQLEVLCYELRADLLDPQAPLPALPGHAFIHARVPVAQTAHVHALQTAGFQLVETVLILERDTSFPPIYWHPAVRDSCAEDAAAVIALARKACSHDRFHQDCHIAPALADSIQGELVANFFLGDPHEKMLVAEENGVLLGFLLMNFTEVHSTPMLIVDVLAVAPHARRQGIAHALLDQALERNGYTHARVGTQLANTPALNLYQKAGFAVREAYYILHLHGERK